MHVSISYSLCNSTFFSCLFVFFFHVYLGKRERGRAGGIELGRIDLEEQKFKVTLNYTVRQGCPLLKVLMCMALEP